jgi:hypothetical protein
MQKYDFISDFGSGILNLFVMEYQDFGLSLNHRGNRARTEKCKESSVHLCVLILVRFVVKTAYNW